MNEPNANGDGKYLILIVGDLNFYCLQQLKKSNHREYVRHSPYQLLVCFCTIYRHLSYIHALKMCFIIFVAVPWNKGTIIIIKWTNESSLVIKFDYVFAGEKQNFNFTRRKKNITVDVKFWQSVSRTILQTRFTHVKCFQFAICK